MLTPFCRSVLLRREAYLDTCSVVAIAVPFPEAVR